MNPDNSMYEGGVIIFGIFCVYVVVRVSTLAYRYLLPYTSGARDLNGNDREN